MDIPTTKSNVLKSLGLVHDIGPKLAAKIWAAYGKESIGTLVRDPRGVAAEISGISNRIAEGAKFFLATRYSIAEPHLPVGQTGINSPGSDGHPTGRQEFDRQTLDRQTSSSQTSVRDFTHGRVPVQERIAVLTLPEVAWLLKDFANSSHAMKLAAEEVVSSITPEELRRYNATGVHVGLKRQTGASGEQLPTSELQVCIRFHVDRKLPADHPGWADGRYANKIAETYRGFPTDVAEMSFTSLGPVAAQDETADVDLSKRADPLVGGYQIASEVRNRSFGTLGGVLFRSNFESVMITNAHVANRDEKIVQPSAQSSEFDPVPIGHVVDAEMPDRNGVGSIDAAIVQLGDDGRAMRARIANLDGPDAFKNGFVSERHVHTLKVIKVGAATGKTIGWVKNISARVMIGSALMINQILVESVDDEPIVAAGDSGALLLSEVEASGRVVGYNIVGLVHARSQDGRLLMATHFYEIARRFRVSGELL
jgi:hypothetical protein